MPHRLMPLMSGFLNGEQPPLSRETRTAHLDDGLAVQPVATDDVTMRLLRCVAHGPGGLLEDFCGPGILSLTEAATQWKPAR